MVKIIVFGFALFAFVNPTHGRERVEFNSIESFVKSITVASIRGYTVGDLMGKGREDWAGIITSDKNGEEQINIYILEKTGSGKYSIVEKSAPRPAFGGTGNYGYEDIEINNKSLFITFSYHWHECAGNSISQFKLYKNNWRMIGVNSFETNNTDGTGMDVKSDTNLITGNIIVTRVKKGISQIEKFKINPRLILFKEFNGDGTISIHEKKPLC